MEQNKNERDIEWHEGDMPYSLAFGDHYYSRADGRAECEHVFLNGNGLPQRWQDKPVFTIAELGFGTGLNFCETWRQWEAKRPANGRLLFISFEKHLLSTKDMVRALNVWPDLEPYREQLAAHWSRATSACVRIDFDDSTALELHVGDALDCLSGSQDSADAWFLDGFAPARNEAMWSQELMRQVYEHTLPDGTFATYTAAGWVRRNLETAGFNVEKRNGYAGKRDMTIGWKAA